MRHLIFQRECLIDLEKSLQQLRIRLITRQGDAVAVLEQLRRETGFSKLFAHEETGTAISYTRDQRVRHWAQTVGVRFEEFSQNGVVRRLKSRDGWNRYWESKMNQPQAFVHPLPRHCVNKTVVQLPSAGLLQPSDLGYEKKQVDCQPGGEHNAGMILQEFVDHRGQFYSGRISSPVTAPKSCSRLSAHPLVQFQFGESGRQQSRSVLKSEVLRHRNKSGSLKTISKMAKVFNQCSPDCTGIVILCKNSKMSRR